MISVSRLTKRFGDRTAVDNVSFSVRKGETLGFLGPNGAGKTTTMRIIAGFLPATEGTVLIDGMDVFEQPAKVKQRIGYMPEQPPLYLDMTADECLGFVAEIHGMRGGDARRAIDRVAGLCGIAEVLPRLAGNLSKGYRQRLGLAQALVHDPDVLILDEPTAGLDPKQIIEVRELIRRLGRDRTVIVSSHILSEVTNLCRRIAIINKGRIATDGSIADLSQRLGGGHKLVMRVARPEFLDSARLAALPGVSGVESADNGAEIRLILSGSDVPREKIAEAVIGMGAGLLEMREDSATMEDIYLKSISGEGVA